VRSKSRSSVYWRGLFHTWSNAHRQHLNGTIDPAIFQGIVQEITAYAQAAANVLNTVLAAWQASVVVAVARCGLRVVSVTTLS